MLNINAIWQGAMDAPVLIVLAGGMALYALCALAAHMAERKRSSSSIQSVKTDTCSDNAFEAPDIMTLLLGCGPIHS